MIRVLYQGAPGAFSHIAARALFPEGDTVYDGRVVHFRELGAALKKGEGEYAVLPIENTLAGSIYENYDNLMEFDLHVHGEYILRVEHHLMGKSGARVGELTKVYSHAKALEQCEGFFDHHPQIEEVVMYDTAAAAQFVSNHTNTTYAAIASREAADSYNLTILEQNIEDDAQNWTRFFLVSTKADEPPTANKCSLIFSVSHEPGSLFAAMQVFAEHNLNMSKIESRPIKGRPFEYYFYVDVEFDPEQYADTHDAFAQLKKHTQYLRVLGYYKKHEYSI